MRTFCYNEPGGERGEINEVVCKTEQEILEEYWDFWKEKMDEKYGKNHALTTKENCIDDWVVLHWAWESTNE